MRSKVASLPGTIETAAPLSANTCRQACSRVMSQSCTMVAKVRSTRNRSRRIILFSCSIAALRSESVMALLRATEGRARAIIFTLSGAGGQLKREKHKEDLGPGPAPKRFVHLSWFEQDDNL